MSIKRLFLRFFWVWLLLLTSSLTAAGALSASQWKIAGIYSSLCSDPKTGKVTGAEMMIIPSVDGCYVVLQIADGEISLPIVTKAVVQQYETGTSIDFTISSLTSTSRGSFSGYIHIPGDSLEGELTNFTGQIDHIILHKGISYWQRERKDCDKLVPQIVDDTTLLTGCYSEVDLHYSPANYSYPIDWITGWWEEVMIVGSREGYYVIFQTLSGYPHIPIIAKAAVTDSAIQFEIPSSCSYSGKFKGYVKNGKLTGTMSDFANLSLDRGRRCFDWQPYGVYSDMRHGSKSGSVEGTEISVMYGKVKSNNYKDYVSYQMADGVPRYPVILEATIDDSGAVHYLTFEIPSNVVGGSGRFSGKISNGMLIGAITYSSGHVDSLNLRHRISYWETGLLEYKSSEKKIGHEQKQNLITGMYSNMGIDYDESEVGGTEFMLVNSDSGYCVIFQAGEGNPNMPFVTKAIVKDSTIEFQLPKGYGYGDKFIGYLTNGKLKGAFGMTWELSGQPVEWKRRLSYLQRIPSHEEGK